MTSEEAIGWLESLERLDKEQDIALAMAIDALKHPRQQCIAKIELPKEELEKIFQKVLHESKQVLPLERKTGKWIDHREDGYVECPVCGHLTTCEGNIYDLHYCFWCGARMEVEDADRD